MKISKIKIENFKGINKFELDAENGKSVNVSGANATGKTSLYDAFLWLLFSKNSEDRSDTSFEIRPIENNDIKHNVESIVEIEFIEPEIKLKKIYHENWVKKRGAIEPVFENCTSDCYIDDVPLKITEYNNRISELCDEKVFKLLSNVNYFSNLNWKDKRKMLTELEEVSDEDIISSNPDFSEIHEILSNKSFDDVKKILLSSKKKLAKEKEQIPTRIDEVSKSILEINTKELKEAELELEEIEKNIETKKEKILNIKNGSEKKEIENKINELINDIKENENKIAKLSNSFSEKVNSDIKEDIEVKNKKELELIDVKQSIASLEIKEKNLNYKIEETGKSLENLEAERIKKVSEWNTVNSKVYNLNISDVCPTCKQKLPKEQIEKIKKESFDNFTKEKKESLEKIIDDGMKLKNKVEEHKIFIKNNNKELDNFIDERKKIISKKEELEKELKELKSKIKDIQDKAPIFKESKEYKKINDSILNIEEAIETEREGLKKINEETSSEIKKLEDEVFELRSGKSKFSDIVNSKKENEKAEKRIEELNQENIEITSNYNEVERKLFLLETFNKTKMGLLESKINEHFGYVSFKMFKQLKNGEFSEDCEIFVDGISYSSNLNNAAKINAGLDIINVFSKKLNFETCIFIDNRESVTEIIETNKQIINLIVNEKFNKLNAEVVK